MKGGQSLNHLQQKKQEKEDELWVKPQPCVICKKVIGGAYANHGDAGWTCSATCMKAQDAKPKYPGHEASTFEELHHATLSGGQDGEVES
jgi:hypothetical protein